MSARALGIRALVGIGVLALLAGCGAGATVDPSTAPASAASAAAVTAAPAATAPATVTTSPTASPTDEWSVVSFSDSVFGNGDDGNVVGIDAYARRITKDLGVHTRVNGFWYGGYTSDEVLQAIRTDAALREALASADVIVFEIPLGEFRSMCPFDNNNWVPAGTPAEWEACAPEVAAHNTANAKLIVDELVALRSPRDAIIRAVNLWEIGYRKSRELGIEPAMHTIFTSANAGVAAAAAAHGIPVVDTWATFMGPDGTTDPVTVGYLLDDMSHLTAKGAIALGRLLGDLGYAKAGPTSVAPSSPAPNPTSTAPVPTAPPSGPGSPTPGMSPSAMTTSVTGSATCTWMHVYAAGLVTAATPCTVTTNDPRVSGTETLDPWHGRQWGGTSWQEGAGVQWGSVRLENAGGVWDGTGSGVYSSDRGDIVVSWFRGTGGYAGLGYFELRTGETPMAIRGLIFPGDPPDLAGIPAVTGPVPSPNVTDTPAPIPAGMPPAVAYGPVSVVEGTSAYTFVDLGSGTYAGIDQVTDPRVSGAYLAPSWTTHFWGATGDSFGTGTQWGPTRLETADGAWQGVGSGILDKDGDVIAMWYTGSGSYAGLAYFELLGSPNLFDPTIPVDRYGVFGQIFPGSPPTP
jgi:hypothetical protein